MPILHFALDTRQVEMHPLTVCLTKPLSWGQRLVMGVQFSLLFRSDTHYSVRGATVHLF